MFLMALKALCGKKGKVSAAAEQKLRVFVCESCLKVAAKKKKEKEKAKVKKSAAECYGWH